MMSARGMNAGISIELMSLPDASADAAFAATFLLLDAHESPLRC